MKKSKAADIIFLSDKTVYFPLDKDKLKDFELCRPNLDKYVRIFNNRIYIRFQWNLLVLFGSKSQLVAFDKIRKEYVGNLIRKHCKKAIECFSKFVGSDTPKSDIDVNFLCPNVEKVIHNILEDHAKTFKDPLDLLFDTNLYGSVFRYFDKNCAHTSTIADICYPKHSSNYKQRVWSFLRIAQTLQNESVSTMNNVVAVMNPAYKRLFSRATTLLTKMEEKKNRQYWYKVYLAAYMKTLREKKRQPQKISEAYSLCKFFENDAYYTVGAVLHIVEKKESLDKNSLYDSIYDNLGFAIETMFSYGICHSLLNLMKISKMCKYLARICDAHMKLTNTLELDDIYKLSEKINTMRKKSNVVNLKLQYNVNRLFKMMMIQSDDVEDIVIGVVRFVLNKLPSDPLI